MMVCVIYALINNCVSPANRIGVEGETKSAVAETGKMFRDV